MDQSLYDRSEVIESNKVDLNFFASFCLPDVVSHRFPEFYEQIFIFLIKKLLDLGVELGVIFRFALSLPRGHAKTTFIKILVVYCVIHDLTSFVLIICANEDRASDFLEDVHAMLLSPNVTALYDSWEMRLQEDNKYTKRGYFRGKKVILQAAGAGTAFRGIVIDNMRPDLIIFDDAQSDKNAESPTDSAKLLRWVTGTAIKTRNPSRCAVIWIGNMYDPPEQCILYHLSNSASWTSLVTGGILADGNALWPELHSVETLLEDYEHDVSLGQGHTWFAEIQNDPTGAPNRLFPDGDFPLTIISPDLIEIGAFITIDPAGNKKNSNDTVITGYVVYEGGKLEVREIIAVILDPEQTIIKAIRMAEDLGAPVIFPESNAYQMTLAFWMDKYLYEFGYDTSLEVIPIVNSASKLSRIREFAKQLLSGNTIIADIAVKSKVLFQGLAFKIEKTDNKDDILDCCANGEIVRNKHLQKCLYNEDSSLYPLAKSTAIAHVRANAHPLAHLRSSRYSR